MIGKHFAGHGEESIVSVILTLWEVKGNQRVKRCQMGSVDPLKEVTAYEFRRVLWSLGLYCSTNDVELLLRGCRVRLEDTRFAVSRSFRVTRA